MKQHKAKLSEPFWPSIVMKKWLNIRPKLHAFSEDENESDTDSDDGIEPKPSSARLRRRKSETLRVNYITKKDVRLMIGTYNVAGKKPLSEIDLSEWLCMEEPADMYILGFQEVVPLNASNVLGAEDRRPILKWESLIRSTLNKSHQLRSIYKSYSAPPSPPLSPSPSNNIETITKSEHKWKLTDLLDWPEYSLEKPVQPKVTGTKLRRVSTSVNLSLKGGLKRVYHSSGNLGMLWSEQEEKIDMLNSIDDLSDKVSDEGVNAVEKSEKGGIEREMKKSCSKFVRIVSKQMVGIYISVWVCQRLRRHVNNLEVVPVGVGLMGYMGNKGSVSISMSLFQTRLCFVTSHLTSGHKDGSQQRRNSDVYEILQRTHFSSLLDLEEPQLIPSHDRIFWFGDLNYRLEMPDSLVRDQISTRKWDQLLEFDQLRKELTSGNTFDGWKEGKIDFPPTYKFEPNSDTYVGEVPREGEKRRTPAWCDRILWLGNGIRQLSYWSSDLKLSDHRPVSALFSVEVEVLDQRKLERVLNFTSAGFSP
ncbi:type I inositol 1,4,5-trisphosphate 5-phosphatase 2 isoform X2 [Carex littledalei]|uniref:Type I inositol 1,4,5-trisphosphate 5-phosphatase 2 isoform X2 n=1 Tax=Carex littledalei TaxID=544730 RepID=A0A833VKP8_9POAL|nr:type I inositol 1,4,5-trisphosphate 5-phosphatase 2 isoform X2 [Carex littledalei]